MNCCAAQAATEAGFGVTAIDTSAAALTVRLAVPLIEPEVAVMVVAPSATLLANPAAVMVAILLAEEPHVTEDVMSFVLWSEYLPVAVNCCFNPRAIEGVFGLT